MQQRQQSIQSSGIIPLNVGLISAESQLGKQIRKEEENKVKEEEIYYLLS